MESIYNELNRFLKGSSKYGLNEEIGRYMLSNLNNIPYMRLAEVAEECHVSTPSIIRFCRIMGCDDYTDFKQCVIDYQLEIKDKVHLPKVNVNALQGDKEYKDTLKGWLNQMQEYANTALLEVNRTQLCELAEDILDYNYVYLFGIGMANIVGEQLRIHLARIGKLAISLTEPQKDVPLTSDIDNTLAVVFSQHGNFFKYEPEILPYLKRNCGKTWLITQCPSSKRFDVSETIRIKANENIEAEYHVLLYFEELLSACCHDLKKQNGSKI